MRIGVVGYGVVGKAVSACFARNPANEIAVYDKVLPTFNTDDHKVQVNECDLVFVCVPTPSGPDGMSCDSSQVEDVVRWVKAPICIKSTVVPGTVDRLTSIVGKPIVFSPEYVGETPWHPWKVSGSSGFVIVGGPVQLCEFVISAYQGCLGPETFYYRTDARTAELCKYMENSFLATKVAFVNQFFDIARVLGVNFADLRELWLADPRIGRSHSMVTDERGFGGSCLPKDVNAMIAAMKPFGGAVLLEAVVAYNEAIRHRAR